MKPFVTENRKTSEFELLIHEESVNIKIQPLVCSLDTIAKDSIQKKIQFNGYFGCSYCLHPGVNVAKDPVRSQVDLGKRSIKKNPKITISKPTSYNQMRYPVLNNIPKRTHEESIQYMLEAQMSRETVKGFKALSPLAVIPKFNVIDGVSIDYMHNCLLGVSRLLLDLWFNSNFSNQPFYTGHQLKKIDERLLKIKPTQEMSRNPRRLEERQHWKANELRNWVLFYGVFSLNRILEVRYLNHFALFSSSIYILLKSEITTTDLSLPKKMLDTFSNQFENLYGPINLTYD